MNWDDLKFFLAIARTGSLTAASDVLKSSPATVSRRLDQLEHALGIKLFSRHQTGYALTDEGAAMMDRAEAAEHAMTRIERAAIGRTIDATGHVRLATAENIANHIIIPALPEFHALHPNITLEIHTGITSLNLTRREADIALRLARPTQGHVAVKKVGVQGYALYGSKDYIASLPGEGAKCTKQARYIGWAEEFSTLPMRNWLGAVAPSRPPILITHSLYAQVVAARAGLGLAILPCFLGDPDPDLEKIPSSVDEQTQEIWLVTHQDLRSSRRVSAVGDFLTNLIQRNSALFSGQQDA